LCHEKQPCLVRQFQTNELKKTSSPQQKTKGMAHSNLI
jgi:hypothetical protein